MYASVFLSSLAILVKKRRPVFIMADESEKNCREFQHTTLCCMVILKFHSLISAVLYLLMIVSCPKLNVKYISYADSHRFHLLVLTGLC